MYPYSLISISTPAGRFNRVNASTVLLVGSIISIRRLCVRISNCSRASLSINGERITVYLSISVGSGTGPEARPCLLRRVYNLHRRLVENAVIVCFQANANPLFCSCSHFFLLGGTRLIAPLQSTMLAFDAGADAGAHGASPLADGGFDSLFHGYPLGQLHRQ